jgi:CRISPR-associated protein Csd1
LKEFWRLRRLTIREKRNSIQQICFATGKWSEILATTEKIKGVPGCLPSGGSLISSNEPAFTSFNLKQGLNAPISSNAEVQLRCGLNDLIQRGMRFPGVVVIHWTTEKGTMDPLNLVNNAEESSVRALFDAPKTDQVQTSSVTDNYYAVCLSGNDGRIIVRDWLATTVYTMSA